MKSRPLARALATVTAAAMVTGCVTHEGRYEPGCTAYAGSTITLSGGSFVWDRFTDQIEIGDDGRPVDPYPDYPRRGAYRLEGRTVVMTADGGERMENHYLHRRDDAFLLLTAAEHAAWESSGTYPDCPLTRAPDSDD